MDIESLLASVPDPTDEYMLSRREAGHSYTLVFLHKSPNWDAMRELNAQVHLEHLQHLTRLQMLGKLVLNGPILVDHEIAGVSVYAAGPEEARLLAEADPKVKAGILTVEAIPWFAVPA